MFVSGIEAFGDDKVVLQEPHMIIFLLPRGLFFNILNCSNYSGRSAAWLAHLPWEQGVGGSNPLAPTKKVNSYRL